MAVLTVDMNNFEKEVLQSEKPVLADFWATWCGPCRMLSPLVEALSEAHPEVKCVKINVDENTELAMGFRVYAIPELMLFKNGAAIRESMGYMDAAALEDFIQVTPDK